MYDDFFNNIKIEYDELTNVYDRHVITSYMDYLLTKNIPFTFAILDIDNFKFINDTYGHLVGDEVLKEVAKSINEVSKDFGILGRYGGDEFIFVFPNVVEYQESWEYGLKLLKSPEHLILDGLPNVSITYTMGLSRFPIDSTNSDELFELADKALYRGKIKGRNCFIIYLAEKHKDIDVLNKRDKIYSPIYLNNKIYNMLNASNNLDEALQNTISFIGSSLMIDHVCFEQGNELKHHYFHPLSKKFDGYIPFGYDNVISRMDTNGFFCKNVIESKYDKEDILFNKFKEQSIYSSVICDVKAYNKHFGFLRAEMTAVDTGRIWQQQDLVVLINFANILGLLFYIKELENK